MIDINAEFARTYATIRKIEAACDKWLTDPDNPDLYDVGLRASEVVVIYDKPIREGDKIVFAFRGRPQRMGSRGQFP